MWFVIANFVVKLATFLVELVAMFDKLGRAPKSASSGPNVQVWALKVRV